MNYRLFVTLSAAIVFGGVVLYLIHRLFRQSETQACFPSAPRREIGFAASMQELMIETA